MPPRVVGARSRNDAATDNTSGRRYHVWYLPELFNDNPMYAGYLVALVGSGLLLLVLGAILAVGNAWARLGVLVVGLVYLGYGAFLYVQQPDRILYSWYALIAPGLVLVAMIVGAIVRGVRARRTDDAAAPAPFEPEPSTEPYGGLSPLTAA